MTIETLLSSHRADIEEIFESLRDDKSTSFKSWSAEKVFRPFQGRQAIVSRDHERGEVTGFSLMQVIPDGLEIHFLATKEAWRRKGVGRSLVNAAIGVLRDNQFDYNDPAIFLEVDELNVEALNFYQNLGFERAGERPGYYPSGSSAILMRLSPYSYPRTL